MIVYPTRGITVTRYIVCDNSEIIIYIMIMPYDIAYTYNIIDHCYLTKSKTRVCTASIVTCVSLSM